MKLVRVEFFPKNPGEWKKLLDAPGVDQDFANRWPIVLKCPQCGNDVSVSNENHTVTFHEDGTFTATPSFGCPHSPCTWHVFINRSEAKAA